MQQQVLTGIVASNWLVPELRRNRFAPLAHSRDTKQNSRFGQKSDNKATHSGPLDVPRPG
jgi:hypothetical protein